MAKNLVIVESPAKVKTIKKFLGSNYEVDASGGHVRDLPKSTLGVDVEHGYEPKYITIRGKGDVLARLRKEVKKADKIYLATDPDREGEAISWHLMKALKLDEQKDKKVYRISFNEITKNAVKASLKEPRAIDENLVDAQQARRMLDRMVGYLISPLLWAKVKRGLSAGRVQSVALRMICDREEEINAFIPEEYWTLDAQLHVHGSRKKLTAHYYGDKDGRKAIHSKEEVEALMKRLEGCEYEVRDVKLGERVKKAPIPFTTSTLQQEASKTLNFSTQKTMRLAQQLYEGRGRCGGEKLYRRPVWGKLRVRGAGGGKIRRQDPGRTRGDPSDRHYTDAGTGKRTAFQRPVPSVPAYLEALHGEPDEPGGLRDNLRQGSSRRGAFYPVGVQNQI